MKSLSTALVAGTILWTAGAADARPDARAMTCAETQALIQSRHAAVLTTGPDTYDRFVRQFGNECDWPEVPMSVAVPTMTVRAASTAARNRSSTSPVE
ncbi:hypothetical protein [Mesorhizobium tamadayense]|uniref:hypothetical protein n=1 Tax=Mesorhizobium tamadayense TaxID=425306 RepID=UPI00315D04A8